MATEHHQKKNEHVKMSGSGEVGVFRMIVFVTGVGGQLGHDVMNELANRGYEGVGADISLKYSGIQDGSAVTSAPYISLDITDRDAVMRTITNLKPDVIVHCAAWTAVDAAEEPGNKSLVHKINVDGTQNLADAAIAVDAKMVYLSTDYVFDGQGSKPWKPDETNFAPLNYYGQTKLEGEVAVRDTTDRYFIVRTSWVFGINGNNFVRTMINAGLTHDMVRVVNDQIGSPTYCYDLARLLVDMIETDKYGCYHATNEGDYISWYDFACEIYRQAGMDTKVIPVTTEKYGLSIATRPFNSRLDRSKLLCEGFEPLPTWQDAVARYLSEADL